jgi:hypothetical protein
MSPEGTLMEQIIEILIDNLRESFKAIEKFLLLGLTASLVLVVLALTNRELSGEQKLMFVDMSAPASIVALVALVTYSACGAFAYFHFAARRRIVKRLIAWNPSVVEALLTYPSIASSIGAPQIVALASVGGLGMIALLLFYVPTHGASKALVTCVILGAPYILLVIMAFKAAVGVRFTSADPNR